MKQIAFVSGKGGTGKSTLVSSLSLLVDNKMLADCDVDAPNLHLVIAGECLQEAAYYGAKQASIDANRCNNCGLCREVCRFNAISEELKVTAIKCEGCGACTIVCPRQAISLAEVKTGQTFVQKTPRGTLAHALLDIGAEGSGKLVTAVRNNITEYRQQEEWILIDGSPGIGCVVIASLTGVDAAVVVTEPTKTGLSDLKRVLAVARHFQIPGFICINKYNLNLELTKEIERFCQQHHYAVIGKIPFDADIVKALQAGKTPIEAGNKEVTAEICRIWGNLTAALKPSEKSAELYSS